MHIPYIPNNKNDNAKRWLTVLSEAMPEHDIRFLEDYSPTEKAGCELAIVANPKHSELAQLPGLKWLHSTWAGVEQLLQNDAIKSVPVVRLQDPELANRMAQTVLSWTLNCQLNLPLYLQQQHQRVWQSHEVKATEQFNVAILGAGNMAQASASLLQQNGYNVSLWGRTQCSSQENYFYGTRGLQKVVSGADVVVILLPLTSETRQLVGQSLLSFLRPSGSLLNFARGDIIDNQALLNALENNKLRHAVLDVFSCEPLPDNDTFWLHPKVTVLPHVAAPTNPLSASIIIAKNIAEYCAKGEIPDTIDKSRGY